MRIFINGCNVPGSNTMADISNTIKSSLSKAGAALVGFADLTDMPVESRQSMGGAVSIAAALDASTIEGIAGGPTERYYQEYCRANNILAELCRITTGMLAEQGYVTKAIEPTVENLEYSTLAAEFAHKTAATQAGQGWIGKSAHLITKEDGPAVRLATVLTDAELPADTPVNKSWCGDCQECKIHCPAQAISETNWQVGMSREKIYNAFACCETATKLSKKAKIPATICGICINACPGTKKYIASSATN